MFFRAVILVAASFAAFAPVQRAGASAVFVIDADGEGFDDATPRAPVGGNVATTLGAQRMAAVLRAADTWGGLLDSKVPIVVAVRLVDLGCDGGSAVLAHAGAAKLVRGVSDSGADPSLWYPAALANRLAGFDLSPGEPDVVMELNSAVDGACRDAVGGWYYGFDGARGTETDLVETVLHELAHGLGFSSSIDAETGELGLPGGVDVYSSHIVDLRTGKAWASLSAAERRQSAQLGKGLAWDGARTKRSTQGVLSAGVDAAGRPLLFTSLPIDRGSAISHFDPRARPDLLMEPFARRQPTHEVDLTLAVLQDLGWTSDCGNGRMDPGEECDDGDGNSSKSGARCRPSCKRARCGDGIVDPGEQCDEGLMSGDDEIASCRSDCRLAACEGTPNALVAECDGGAACSARCGDAAVEVSGAPNRLGGDQPALVRRTEGCALGAAQDASLPGTLLFLFGSLMLERTRRVRRASRRA